MTGNKAIPEGMTAFARQVLDGGILESFLEEMLQVLVNDIIQAPNGEDVVTARQRYDGGLFYKNSVLLALKTAANPKEADTGIQYDA